MFSIFFHIYILSKVLYEWEYLILLHKLTKTNFKLSDRYTVEVVIPIPLSQTFDYIVSKLEFENLNIGARIIVSFGQKKLYTAVVVDKYINKQ